jgi:hypothetical protein
MILVRLWGGLGNQMFQYATAKALALRLNTNLKIDLSLLENQIKGPLEPQREFDLRVFNIEPELASTNEVNFYNPKANSIINKLYAKWLNLRFPNRTYIEKYYHFDRQLNLLKDNTCIVGNWQSPKYFQGFENEIRSELTFREGILIESKELAAEIMESNSVCINVRRSDYLTHPEYSKILGFRGLEYLQPAIEKIKCLTGNPSFFIFSDDIKWCNEVLQPIIGGKVIDHNHKGWKFGNYLHLMSLCKHQIIPNSTFGWWAAWLNQNPEKIVIAPKIWYQDKSFDTKDLCPENWIRL